MPEAIDDARPTAFAPPAKSRLSAFSAWSRRVALPRKAAIGLTAAAVLSGLVTFVTVSGSGGVTSDPSLILALVVADLVLLVSLGGIVIWRVAMLWAERRSGAAGSRLHMRMAALFAVLTAAPSIVLMVLAALFFGFEVQAWFGERVRTAVQESVQVAEAYLREHKQVIAADALAMANDLTRLWPETRGDTWAFNGLVEAQARVRALDDAFVFDESGRYLAQVGLDLQPRFGTPPPEALQRAARGELVILTGDEADRLQAMVGLRTTPLLYLIVSRRIDPAVLAHTERAKNAADIYDAMTSRRAGIEATFAAVFVMVALLMLLAAVAVGLNFATRLAHPISRLVGAAEAVRLGNLSLRVEEGDVEDELGTLTRAFNRMTAQLGAQRRELVDANRELDERSRFTETVLAGVSAGVVGLDAEGRINLPNRSALALLGASRDAMLGRSLLEVVPEMSELFAAAQRRPGRLAEGQIELQRDDGAETLHVRIAAEVAPGGTLQGYVVTIDDVTALLSAQRKAAWADVARRLAHEIKNPLTPIQLSAERLKRKYLGEITQDRETFEQCTDTIVRQVGDIGRLIDEFAAFARMPAPSLRETDLGRLCRETVFLQRSARPDIVYAVTLPEEGARLLCDGGMVAQALTNVLKNAAEAIDARRQRVVDGEVPVGRIALLVQSEPRHTRVVVEDDGEGLPEAERRRLTEPYVTTRAKGTGLGLAIVKKIMEDHGGDLIMDNRDEGGARVVLVFPNEPAEERGGALAPKRDDMRPTGTDAAHGA